MNRRVWLLITGLAAFGTAIVLQLVRTYDRDLGSDGFAIAVISCGGIFVLCLGVLLFNGRKSAARGGKIKKALPNSDVYIVRNHDDFAVAIARATDLDIGRVRRELSAAFCSIAIDASGLSVWAGGTLPLLEASWSTIGPVKTEEWPIQEVPVMCVVVTLASAVLLPIALAGRGVGGAFPLDSEKVSEFVALIRRHSEQGERTMIVET